MSTKKTRIVRKPRQAALNFALQKVTPFSTAGAAIGLQPGDITFYTDAVNAANDSFTVLIDLKEQLKRQTTKVGEDFAAMNRVMTRTVEKIDLFAEGSADPQAVWDLATIGPPNNPSQMPEPGEPFGFKAALNSDGSVKISWKCKNPEGAQGTVYIVRRRLNNTTTWSQVALTASKHWTDGSIPSSSGGAMYTVQAQRGNVTGPVSSTFNLQFGTDGGGNFAITGATEGVEGKLAA